MRLRSGSLQATAHGGFEAVVEVVDALLAPVDSIAEAVEDLIRGEPLIALAGVQKLVADGAVYPGIKRFDALLDAVLGGGDEFGCRRRRGGAEIGDKIGRW